MTESKVTERPCKRRTEPYPLSKKMSAFFRGLRDFQPLVEVAKQGLSGSYSLPFDLEIAYAKKVRACGIDEIYDVLRNGCSNESQEILCQEFVFHFERGLKILSVLNRLFWEANHPIEEFVRYCRPEAEELNEIREMAQYLIISGTISSERAQHTLVSLFQRHTLLDGYFDYFVTHRFKQAVQISSAGHTAQSTKNLLSQLLKNPSSIKTKGDPDSTESGKCTKNLS